MAHVELHYLASREWLESEILAGRPVDDRRQILEVELELVEKEMQERIEAIVDGVVPLVDPERVKVFDSGIDPMIGFGPSDDELIPMDEPVIAAIGELPELDRPTESIREVVEAWEGWIELYMQKSLERIEGLNADPPAAGWDRDSGSEADWGPVRVSLGHGVSTEIGPADGAAAMRDACAAWSWERELHETILPPSLDAGIEAAFPDRHTAEALKREMPPAELAAIGLDRIKRAYAAAKAHRAARRELVPNFDAEMRRWAEASGSERLQLGIEDGYRMNARYLTERLAKEAPGFYAMSGVTPDWAMRASSPSEQALRLRRRVQAAIDKTAPVTHNGRPQAEICFVTKPPHQIYMPHESVTKAGNVIVSDFPSQAGWPWRIEAGNVVGSAPHPFEAVVVEDWLGRFNLIGAVANADGQGPPGIWAVPEFDHYHEDGSVEAQDPDAEPPRTAKRKPPGSYEDDDFPF